MTLRVPVACSSSSRDSRKQLAQPLLEADHRALLLVVEDARVVRRRMHAALHARGDVDVLPHDVDVELADQLARPLGLLVLVGVHQRHRGRPRRLETGRLECPGVDVMR